MFFYPPAFILRYFLPVNLAIAWGIALHLWVAGIGMYWLCRHFSLRLWIALACAFTFMLGGGFTTRIFGGHIWKVYALAWMPILWLCLESALERDNWLGVFGGAGVLALIILSGHPTFPGYALLFLGLYWLYETVFLWQQERRLQLIFVSGAKFFLLCILGIGLASIQLLPSIVFASQASLASGYGFAEANLGALMPVHLWMILLPDAYQQPGQAIWELIPYLGVLLPLAVPWAFVNSRYQRKAFFLGFVAVFSLALAFGDELRVFNLMYYGFPPFRVLRIPARALSMWIPSVIVLGGIGLQVLSEQLPKLNFVFLSAKLYRNLSIAVLGTLAGYIGVRLLSITLPLSITLTMLAVVIIGLVLFVALQLSLGETLPTISPHLPTAIPLLGLGLASVLLGIVGLPLLIPTETAVGDLVLGFGKLAVLLVVGSLLFPLLYQSQRPLLFSLLVTSFIFLDVYSFGAKYVQISDPPAFDPLEVQVLKIIPPPPEAHLMGGDVLRGSNRLMPLKLSNIDGYYSGMLTDYAAYLRGVAENPPLDTVVLLSNTDFPRLDRRALDYLNVTHVFSRNPLDMPGYKLVGETPSYFVYHNLNAMPRAFWVSDIQIAMDTQTALQVVLDPNFDYRTTVVMDDVVPFGGSGSADATVTITGFQESSGGLTIQVQSLRDGVLVTSEPYYSERRAWLDGVEVPLLKANVAFSAVALPAGFHTIQIGYVPTSLYIGIGISVAALLICIAASTFILLKHQRRVVAR
jgi:hypothetical protein